VSDEPCLICRDRPAHGAYGCTVCLERARRLLGEIGDMTQAALDVAQRQAVRGGGGGSGKPGSSLPIDLGAMARYDAVKAELGTWARHVAEERGVNLAEINAGGLTMLSRDSVRVDQVQGLTDDLSGICTWLADHCEWLRHRREVDEFVRDVGLAASIIRGLASGPRERIYLGPCGAYLLNEDSAQCEEPLYGRLGAGKATCRTCGAQHGVDQRIQERHDLAHSYTYTAAEIEHAYGGVILASTIRQWRKRGLLTVHGEADGRRLYAIGEVLQVAATAKERQRRTAEMGA
jgi:hypothetical protein